MDGCSNRQPDSPVVNRPADHPHSVIGERSDGEAGDEGQRVEGRDKDFAKPLVPLVVGVLPTELDDGVHGDGDSIVKNVRPSQGADEELQRLPFLLLCAHAENPPGVGKH